MNLVVMMDELLRNRGEMYRQAREETRLGTLSARLLVFFLLSSAIYGGVMGAYRCLHPVYFFSDFELTAGTMAPVYGKVAGMAAEERAVYTRAKLPADLSAATVRFNLTDPSNAYRVAGVSEEKGYSKITLAADASFMEEGRWQLPFLVALKMPALFLLTLLVCALALYILNLAFGMQLRLGPTMVLMLFALAGTGVMLVVFAPIAMLFTVVTSSYHFMKIMHVAVFLVAGFFGIKILGEGLMNMQEHGEEVEQPHVSRKRVQQVLFSWLLLYCLVGAQLAWTLKPFLGTPYLPATPPFRLERGNIFVSTIESLRGIRPAEAEETPRDPDASYD